MADIKISQLTAKAAKVESTDRIPIADFNGTTYDTKYVTGAQINELSLDTSPQLGGNLDVNGHTITSDSDQDVIINPNGTGTTKIESNLVLRDSAGSTAKEILFYEGFSNGTNYVSLKAADSLTANTTYTLPTADGTSGQVLSTNGTGTLSWTNNDSGLTVNSTAITSGTAGRVFFQNASNQLSQSANLFWDNSNNRLGINIATPTVALDVAGAERIVSNLGGSGTSFSVWNTTTERFRVQENGNVSFNNWYAFSNLNELNIAGGRDATNAISLSALNSYNVVNVTRNLVRIANTISHTSGSTNDTRMLTINPTINVTGGTSTIRGLYYDPTLTSTTGVTNIAIQATTGSVIFNSTSGNVAIGGTSFGTSSDKVLAQYTGTAPGSSPSDAYQQYSADITAGNAAPHFRTENGNVVKLYQQSSAGITTVSDLVTILQNLGLLS
jgi:hypothetical protein